MSARKSILLIDDNHDTLDLLEMYLYRDYEIHTALNGFEGIERAREVRPGCIITDIMMPVMDGIKFLNTLRKDDELKDIPVIAVTSFVRRAATKSLTNIGFVEALAKPIDRATLVDAVNRVFEEK